MTRPLILIVEDEAVMRRVLLLALDAHGYSVVEAVTGEQALTRVHDQPPDAVILDLGLPDMDGVAVARAVRDAHDLPIIVLSARNEEQEQIRALDAGVNDYVTKPFREGELMARVRAALRHGARLSARQEMVVGDIRIDAVERRVFLRDTEVELTPTEFKLLHLLAREAGRVVTHDKLLREVWGPAHVEDLQYLRVFMKQLRKKLEAESARPKRITTAPGIGYRLVAR